MYVHATGFREYRSNLIYKKKLNLSKNTARVKNPSVRTLLMLAAIWKSRSLDSSRFKSTSTRSSLLDE